MNLPVRRSPGGRWVALAIGALCLSASGPATADGNYPDYLREHLQMPCKPGCTPCHATDQGGPHNLRFTTTGQPGFGATLESKFDLLVSSDKAPLFAALDAAAVAKSDIDGDGVIDTEELHEGRDPNDPNPDARFCGANVDTGPEYGCFSSSPSKGSGSDGGTASVIGAAPLTAIAAYFSRRRSRRAKGNGGPE
jgi:MYXO-CTERM domain-containing protein